MLRLCSMMLKLQFGYKERSGPGSGESVLAVTRPRASIKIENFITKPQEKQVTH